MSHRLALFITLLGAILISSCSEQKQTAPAEADAETLTYGYGVVPNPAVTYQPDVVIVGGGPKAVRSVSADGLTWVIDGQAPHARELQPGKVIFTTSRLAGRIMSTQAVGNDVAVTLGPAHLGEILRDADLKVDFKFDPGTMYYQTVPAMQGMYRDYNAPDAPPPVAIPIASAEPEIEQLDAQTILVRLAPIQIAAADVFETDRPTGTLPMTSKSAPKISINDWEIEPSFRRETPPGAKVAKIRDRIGVKIQRKLGERAAAGGKVGLKAGFEIVLWTRDLYFRTHTVYKDGKLDRDSMTVVVDGLEGFDVSILSGIEKAAGDNMKVRLEVPIEWNWPLPPAATEGVPMVAQIKVKFLIETALGGANATLNASGKYELDGPLGIENGKIIVPKAKATEPVVTAEDSVSLGVSGLVFTSEVRFLIGVGPPALFAGPYAKITGAIGVTKSADVAIMMAPRCSGSTVKLDAGVGLGIQLKASEIEALAKLLGKKAKAEWEVIQQSNTFYRKDTFAPDVPACRY